MFVRICGPNLNDQSKGTFHVHLDGCKDLLKYGPGTRFGGDVFGPQEMMVQVDDRVDVVKAVYSDQLREAGDVKPIEWLYDFHFAPCCKDLPDVKVATKNLVDIVSWDHRDQPDAENITNAIQIGGRFCWYYNNGSDMHNLAFFKDRVVDEDVAKAECDAYFEYINS